MERTSAATGSTSQLSAVPPMADADVRKSHLEVPAPMAPRRSSLDSSFSDISNVSSKHSDHALTRKSSNVSNVSTYSSSSAYVSAAAAAAARPLSLRQRLAELYDQNYGALLVLLSQFFGTLMNIFTRILEHKGTHGAPMHPFQILFARQSITVLLCALYAFTTKSIPHFPLGPPDRKVRMLLVCRGITGFFGVFGMYFSLLYLPLSEATVLTFLAPILSCYLCSLVLPGETFTRQQQLAGFVSLVGVIFIAQPASFFSSSAQSTVAGVEPGSSSPTSTNGTNVSSPSSAGSSTGSLGSNVTPSQHLLAVGIAMLGVCGATGAYTSIRAIGTRAHALVSVNYFSTWSSIVSLVALAVIPSVSFRLPGNLIEWALLLSLGTTGFIMQGLLTVGLSYKAKGDGPAVQQQQSKLRQTRDYSTENGEEDIEMQTPLQSTSETNNTELATRPDQSHSETSSSRPQRRRRTRRSSNEPITSKTTSSSGTKATSMIYVQMLFALAGDRIVFGTTPGPWSWIGSGLILAGAIWVASAKDKPKESPSHISIVQPNSGLSTIEPELAGAAKEERTGLLDDQDNNDVHDLGLNEDSVSVGQAMRRMSFASSIVPVEFEGPDNENMNFLTNRGHDRIEH